MVRRYHNANNGVNFGLCEKIQVYENAFMKAFPPCSDTKKKNQTVDWFHSLRHLPTLSPWKEGKVIKQTPSHSH